MTFPAVIMGISQRHSTCCVNAGWHTLAHRRAGCERAGLNGQRTGLRRLNGRRAASARGATICADENIAKLAFRASDETIFLTVMTLQNSVIHDAKKVVI